MQKGIVDILLLFFRYYGHLGPEWFNLWEEKAILLAILVVEMVNRKLSLLWEWYTESYPFSEMVNGKLSLSWKWYTES